MKVSWFPLAFASLIFISGCNQNRSKEAIGANDVRKTIQLTDLAGQSVDLTKYEGRVVFLNFWATWCRPCIEEMPSIASAKKLLGNTDIVFLFASDEDVERIKSFEKKNSLGLEYVQVTNFNELSIQALPTTYIFDASGKTVFSETGYRKWDDSANLQLLQNLTSTNE